MDGDGVLNLADNCPDICNPWQEDYDGHGDTDQSDLGVVLANRSCDA